jgi:hypothetical protein
MTRLGNIALRINAIPSPTQVKLAPAWPGELTPEMARKLLIALWRYTETGVIPAGVEMRAQAVVAA